MYYVLSDVFCVPPKGCPEYVLVVEISGFLHQALKRGDLDFIINFAKKQDLTTNINGIEKFWVLAVADYPQVYDEDLEYEIRCYTESEFRKFLVDLI